MEIAKELCLTAFVLTSNSSRFGDLACSLALTPSGTEWWTPMADGLKDTEYFPKCTLSNFTFEVRIKPLNLRTCVSENLDAVN